MPPVLDVVLLVVLLALVTWQLTWTAGRLDRLHGRVEGARAALDAALLRRATAVLELAGSGLLDPATSVILADTAHAARTAGEPERELAESQLSVALRAVLDEEAVAILREEPVGEEALVDLADACRRVALARRLHNDAVRSATVLRRKRVVRWARLAGHAGAPGSFEIDDEVPPALAPQG
ncbi:hypothetical protein EV189_1208 [Motilibacter rhizosphaerae]|uniref:LemA protein n=1 Tax=Motilibacter rhizosphaerae TaxID=598652 RepID=A0A4Q7NR50_9ACTN|nr:hypothetical protein [Motilibacter rhizosphaerae]RZS89445.1 hypothetical protein EV189_1208 [Motilibacter rhizosphaerae]